MESYVLKDREKDLNIKQIMLYIREKMAWFVVIGLIFGIIFGGFGFIKSYKSENENTDRTSIQDIIAKDRTKWNALDVSALSDSFTEPLPETYIANAKVFIDFDYSEIEGNANLDFSAMNSRLQGDMNLLAVSNESRKNVIDNLNLRSYEDMESLSLDDLKYMTSCGFSGANIMQIQVADVDSDRAVAINSALLNRFVETAAQYDMVDNVKILEEPSIIFSSEHASLGTVDFIKQAIKYAVVGIIVGIIMACAVIFLMYLLDDSIRTVEDVQSLDIGLFGILPTQKKRKDIEYKRLINNISLLNKKNVVVVPVDAVTNLEEFKEKVVGDVKKAGCTLCVTDNLMDNPDVILDVKENDSIIIALTYGKTSFGRLQFVKNELKKVESEIMGVLLIETNR